MKASSWRPTQTNASSWRCPPQTKTSSWPFRSRAPPPCRQGRQRQWGFSTVATASTSCKKSCSKLLSTGTQTPKKKTNAQAFDPASWMAARPLREDVSMGRGSCRKDPLLWGRGEEVDGSRHEKNMEKHDIHLYLILLRVHTLALCTLT